MSLTFGSLFAGIGGFDLGFTRAGMRAKWFAEKDKQATSVMIRQFGSFGLEHIWDVRDVKTADHVQPDIICGGFPCQDLSVAGKRAGLAGERSGLWYEFRRILAEFAPTWVCIENVPGLLSSNCGLDFGIILGALGQLGYGWAYRVVDSQWFGVPQRRRRVFVVGCLGDARRAAAVLFEPEGLPWDSPPSRETKSRVANSLTRGAERCGGRRQEDDFNLVAFGGNNTRGPIEVSTALNASASASGRQDFESETFVTHTLRAEGHDASEDGTGRGVPLVAAPLRGNYHCDQDGDESKLVAGTLQATDGGMDSNRIGELVAKQSGVRRLTPIECERLQGFPDDWTRYGHDGTEMSDSARYRMLGNAVTVNVAEWIGRRIMAAN